jgi:hypothetical protein
MTTNNQKTLEFRWTVSRGRDTYGYNICSLYVDGRKAASCNGGGYDMQGTSLGNWIARNYADRLLALTPEQMPEQSHWQPDRTRTCDGICKDEYLNELADAIENHKPEPKLATYSEDTWTCPVCNGPTRSSNDGKRINDGRYFYGLTFHNPNYDPGKAIVGTDCQDRTLSNTSEAGKTVEQVEAEGKSVGLERYQAFYSASSKQPTQVHRVPLIDGACGMSSVQAIMKAIGLEMEYVPTRKRNDSIYILHDRTEEVAEVK